MFYDDREYCGFHGKISCFTLRKLRNVFYEAQIDFVRFPKFCKAKIFDFRINLLRLRETHNFCQPCPGLRNGKSIFLILKI